MLAELSWDEKMTTNLNQDVNCYFQVDEGKLIRLISRITFQIRLVPFVADTF